MNMHTPLPLFTRHTLVISGGLEVCAPLMLGNGTRMVENALTDGNQTVEVNQIVEDYRGLPYLPGSSLKGVLKRLLGSSESTDRLMGLPHQKGTSSGMGLLRVYGADCNPKQLPAQSHLPYFDKNRGSGINARTAIDPVRGVAAKSKLIHERHVAAGTRFELRMEYLLSDDPDTVALLGNLLGCMSNGFALGRSTGSGLGRVRLIEPKLWVEGITNNGDWGKVNIAHGVTINHRATPQVAGKRIYLKITCDGPYLVNDPSWEKALKKIDADKRKKLPKLKSLGMAGDVNAFEAILPGSSLKGALRNRSAWIEACTRGNTSRELTDQLFGDTERKARLRIETITSKHEGHATLESVKIDRFSNAPIEKALFSCECFVNPEFNVVLFYDEKNAPTETNSHLERLLQDICEEGLVLGHGGNKGFGWCTVEVTQ